MKRKSIAELATEEKRNYFRQWRSANKEKVKKHNADYWKRRAEKRLKEKEE